MSTKIRYSPDLPVEVLSIIQPLLKKWKWLIPTWCQELWIVWTPEGINGQSFAGANQARYDYRDATIHFHPDLLDEASGDQEYTIVHELLHTFGTPLVDWVIAQFANLVSETLAPQYHKTLMVDLMERHESATTDLSNALVRQDQDSRLAAEKKAARATVKRNVARKTTKKGKK
jgi:hypothetical protein